MSNFSDTLYAFLRGTDEAPLEKFVGTIYNDGKEIPTLGVGVAYGGTGDDGNDTIYGGGLLVA